MTCFPTRHPRLRDLARTRTPPPETAERLGLPTNVGYFVEGVLKDTATGHIVSLPTDQTLTVPVRWLHPLP